MSQCNKEINAIFLLGSQDKYFEKLDKVSGDDPKLYEKFMGQLHAPVPDLAEGFTNFQKLLTDEGGEITVLELAEGKEIE